MAVPSSEKLLLNGDIASKICLGKDSHKKLLASLKSYCTAQDLQTLEWSLTFCRCSDFPDSSDVAPTPLGARKIHTTWLIESHLSWLANPAEIALSEESRPPDIAVGRRRASFPPNFPLVETFSLFYGSDRFLRWKLGICCLYQHVSFPNQKNATSRSAGKSFPAIIAEMVCAPFTSPQSSARHLCDGDLSFLNSSLGRMIETRVLAWQSCCRYLGQCADAFVCETNRNTFSDVYAAHVRSHRLQAGGQTRVVAYASIASFVFSGLIQQPGVEPTILIRLPRVWGNGDRDRYCVLACNWQSTTEMHRPRTVLRLQPARFYVIVPKSLQGFAMSLSSFNADHHLVGAVFLSLFTKRDASPTCIEEAHLHRPAGITS